MSFRSKDDQHGPKSGKTFTKIEGQNRGEKTHASTTDAGSNLVRKGPGIEVRLFFGSHAAVESRLGLCVVFDVSP